MKSGPKHSRVIEHLMNGDANRMKNVDPQT